MYKLIKPIFGDKINSVLRIADTASIPFDPDNTDYAQFKKDILEGAELLGADGQVMDATQFAKELP
jgi:hypothetical protein